MSIENIEVNQESQPVEAFYGLPREVRFCKKCVISNQRPSSTVEFKNKKDERKATILIDEEGICDACNYAVIKDNSIDWKDREKQLVELLNQYRRDDGHYDVLVPGSGGKDSIYMAHVLKYKYNMHPLTFTWTPHIYTDIGWRNFQSWIHSGFDNVLFSPNGKVHRLLTRLAFENLGHPFQPFIIGQRAYVAKVAVNYNIKLIFYGENQSEYGNPLDQNYKPTMDKKFFSIHDPFREIVLGGISMGELISKYNLHPNDLEPYIPPKLSEIEEHGINYQYGGYYIKWDPQECYYYASEHTGFQPNTERTEGSYSKYSSIDDRIDPFHYYTTFIKFGIGRATYDAAQEIRNHKITREEGVALVRRYDSEFPKKYFKEVLEYMGITEERFWQVIDGLRSPHLWEKRDGQWHLKYQVE